jgi:hypothetical protein
VEQDALRAEVSGQLMLLITCGGRIVAFAGAERAYFGDHR